MANLRPGTFSDTVSITMAQAIERAFIAQWPSFNPELPPPRGKQLQSMRLLFVAVAQGVIQHLRDNPDAFNVSVASADHSHSGGAHFHPDGAHVHAGGSHVHPAILSSISSTGTTA